MDEQKGGIKANFMGVITVQIITAAVVLAVVFGVCKLKPDYKKKISKFYFNTICEHTTVKEFMEIVKDEI